MSKHDLPSPLQPALILMYGSNDKKYRPLGREVTVIGRARGCDIGLDAADVSTIHCVVNRHPDGFFLRDYQSRSGTRLNGEVVKESVLQDGDILQIGPFSFQVHIPEKALPGGVSRVPKLIKSRKRLTRLALKLRQRLRQAGPTLNETKPVSEDQERRAATLKEKIRVFDQRVSQLEEAERELARERELLDNEKSLHREYLQEADQELNQRRAAMEVEIQERRGKVETDVARQISDAETKVQSLLQKAAVLEKDQAEVAAKMAGFQKVREALEQRRIEIEEAEGRLQGGQELLQHGEMELDRRRTEIEAEIRARLLAFEEQCRQREQLALTVVPETPVIQVDPSARRKQEEEEIRQAWHEFEEQCREREKSLAQRQQELDSFAQKLREEKETLERIKLETPGDEKNGDNADVLELLETQRRSMSEAEVALREERAELARMMGDLRQMQEALRSQAQESGPLKVELDHLKKLLAQREQQFQALQASGPDPNLLKDLESLRAENQQMRQMLQEKDQLLVTERQRVVRESSERAQTDIENYETELNEYRRQLETDREKLAQEIEAMRDRQAELDDMTRDMEMEFSRERAKLGQERTRLERLREEVKSDLERMQRESGLRESLAPLTRLREELTHRRQPPSTPQPSNPPAGVADRLRGFRDRLSDSTKE